MEQQENMDLLSQLLTPLYMCKSFEDRNTNFVGRKTDSFVFFGFLSVSSVFLFTISFCDLFGVG